MTRTLIALPLLLLIAGQTGKAEQNQLDTSPALFAVMAAINAAGYDADLHSAANHPLRQTVRDQLSKKNLKSVGELKQFFTAHRQKDWNAELSQYVSFALSVDGPPGFPYHYQPHELPPDVLPLAGLNELLANFYREANLEELWKQAQPVFEQALGRYHEPVIRAVLETNGYLRNPTSGYLGRRFQIYIDLLAAPNQIHTRSYKDDYFVVITPSPEPQIDEVRHAYLHYLLDPLAFKYAEPLKKKGALADYVSFAPALEEYYKSDFLLLATESLIKAIESRLAAGGASKRQAMAAQALKEGFILTPYFFEQLPAYEKQERAMRLYFPDMVSAIDLKKEEKRLEKVEFATALPTRAAKVVPAERKVELAGVYKTLEEAQNFYADRDLEKAKMLYLRVLEQTAEKPVHANAYYGLARIAALEKQPDLAEKLFRKTIESSPDLGVKSWSYVYLGRLADAAGERDSASENYKAALAVDGASAAARQAAEKGLREAFTKEK